MLEDFRECYSNPTQLTEKFKFVSCNHACCLLSGSSFSLLQKFKANLLKGGVGGMRSGWWSEKELPSFSKFSLIQVLVF